MNDDVRMGCYVEMHEKSVDRCPECEAVRPLLLRDEIALRFATSLAGHYLPFSMTIDGASCDLIVTTAYNLTETFLTERTRQREAGGK